MVGRRIWLGLLTIAATCPIAFQAPGGAILGSANARMLLAGGPFSQQGPSFAATTQIGEADFGNSVALSADGNTAVVGGHGDNEETGAAWIYTRSGATWTEQAKLSTGEKLVAGYLGFDVALSADGNTALLSGLHNGAVVFARSDSGWAKQGTLPGSTASVALSADGNTALAGEGVDAKVFTRSDGVWTEQAQLTTTEKSGGAQFGRAVALSSDGSTALIGGPDDYHQGAAWVFVRAGSTWHQQGGKLRVRTQRFANFGFSVALSGDASTALIGALGAKNSHGAAWVFTRAGEAWKQQGPALAGREEAGQGLFGFSVALTNDGGRALIGGWGDGEGAGAAWQFRRSGRVWTQQGPKLIGRRGPRRSGFGESVALSSSGSTGLIGGSGEHLGQPGAVWAFEAR